MIKKLRLALSALLLLLCSVALSQAPKAQWSIRIEPPSPRAGESAQIIATAEIAETWHIYSIKPVKGPEATTFTLPENQVLEIQGEAVEPTPHIKVDKNFGNVIVGYHEGPVSFGIPVKVKEGVSGEQQVTIEVLSQACDPSSCERPESVPLHVSFEVGPGGPRPDRMTAVTAVPEQPEGWTEPKNDPSLVVGQIAEPNGSGESGEPTDETALQVQKARSSGPLAFFWLSFTFGLLALVTPCVFPMIPVTVSYFSKRTGESKNLAGAIAYCLGILGTFTILGLAVTLIFGASGITKLATNPIVNLFLALLFVVLALNLFGVFEFRLPNSWVNKASAGSRQGGLLGPVLMGLTFSLTTFTCTVPFVGTILVSAAQGDILYPIIGMLGFSSAFAIPFFFLALFPQFLNKMPKSGAWLATVKVFMGFLELAAALKFLSNTDLVWQLGLITKEVFLAVWVVVFSLSALYLFGWIRLGHEGDSISIGWLRRGFGVAMLGVAIFCLSGLQGRPLGTLAAFLPPDPYPGKAGVAAGGIAWEHSYQDALAKAKAQGKPLFINFTGFT